MRNTLHHIFFVSLLLMLAWTTALADISALYTAEAAVEDESAEQRNAALSQMLGSVLVRVSGNTGIAGQPAASTLLASAPSLVQQYRYRSDQAAETAKRVLWARFDQPAVERMMRERNLPVWTQRPAVLLWLATERKGARSLLNLENESEARESMLERANERGMPLQLPLMDLEDQAALTAADLWSGYAAGIRAASARYPHDVVLSGRLTASSGGKFKGVWELAGREDSQLFETPALPLAESLSFAVDQAQNLLAARYAPMPGAGGAGGTLVSFSGIADLAAYGRLLGAIADVEAIVQKALRYARDDRLVFEFQLRGDAEDLRRVLDADGRLLFEPNAAGAPGAIAANAEAATGLEPTIDYAYRLTR